jgi:ribosomal protein S24E
MVGKQKEALVLLKTKTDLGRQLAEIRARIVASGETLLDWDDLEREIADRRNEQRENDNEKASLC